MPARFDPEASYPLNRLRWYANITVPPSYVFFGSRSDSARGYDHAREAGLVHFANHHIAPGKKQWTWGNHEFGYAWDHSLTDSDGPYIELMAGVYTDNQPDFSFLAPGETKVFSQYWYPIREIGVPDLANLDAAMRVERVGTEVRVHLQVTSTRPASLVRIRIDGRPAGIWQGDLLPESPLHHTFTTVPLGSLEVIAEQAGRTLLHYAPDSIIPADKPEVATEPPLPEEVATADELFFIGLHLEQYRHPTRLPELYWQEAIHRDPQDSRSNHALGRWYLRRGEFALAEQHLRISIARTSSRNPNPPDGEPHYNLGQALLFQQRTDEAYAAFYKSTWNAAWRGPGYHRLAEIDCARGEWSTALDHIERSLRTDVDNLNARNLKTVILRRLGCATEAAALLEETRALDPLDNFSRFLAADELPHNGQQRLDLIFDLLRAGLHDEALAVASAEPCSSNDGTAALLLYAQAHILHELGQHDAAAAAYAAASAAPSRYVFPNRIEEMLLLEEAIRVNARDARAPFYLGNLLYDRRRHREAIALWERAAELDPAFPTAWRNLGFGYFNILDDAQRALNAFTRARAADPTDARILYEQDQLLKRTGESLQHRLASFEIRRELVDKRDDLSLELATLYNSTGQPELALEVLLSRPFQPWEGGEGLVLSQFVRAHILLGQRALRERRAKDALRSFQQAWNPPQSLNEARHLLMNLSMIDYWLGIAYQANGLHTEATCHFERAASQRGDFQQMQVQPISEMTCWSALALQKLGRAQEAQILFHEIDNYAIALASQTPKIDYFATSLPAMLLFEEDLAQRQRVAALFLKAQALFGLGNTEDACTHLEQVLELDRNHAGAIDLRRSIEG